MPKRRILLIEDEDHVIEVMKIVLEKSNYEVITAPEGYEGLEMAKKEWPDLIILDLMLPNMDGHTICRLLKNDTKYNKIPIIILTAKSQNEDGNMSRAMGADLYITKPPDLRALLTSIEELLKMKEKKEK